MRLIPWILLLSLVLGSDAASAEEGSDEAAKAARERERLRVELLVAYRRLRSIHVTFGLSVSAKRKPAEPSHMSLFVEDDRIAFQAWSDEGAEEAMNRAWLITPGRYVILADEEEEPTVARGRDFHEQRVRRINDQLARMRQQYGFEVARTPPMRLTIELLIRRPSDAELRGSLRVAVAPGDGNPSWLRKDLWEQQRVEDANEEYVLLRGKHEQRWIDRRSGMLLRARATSRDGSRTLELSRELNVHSEQEWRLWMRSLEKRTVDTTYGNVGAAVRVRQLSRLLEALHAALPARSPKAANCLKDAAPRLVQAIYDDALATEELGELTAWGRSMLEASTKDGAEGKSRADVRAEMEKHLFDRWWGHAAEDLPEKAGEDGLPARDSPIAVAFRKAVKAYAKKRIAAAEAE